MPFLFENHENLRLTGYLENTDLTENDGRCVLNELLHESIDWIARASQLGGG